MLSSLLRSLEFGFYHCLLSVVDRVSRLPRNTTMPEAARLYRENIALKAQLDVLEARLKREEAEVKPRPNRSLRERAAQVFAYLLTRENEPFQRYFLSAPLSTIRRWSCRFRKRRYEPLSTGGRPGLAPENRELILTLKRENGPWGQKRIHEELRRMGVRVCRGRSGRYLMRAVSAGSTAQDELRQVLLLREGRHLGTGVACLPALC